MFVIKSPYIKTEDGGSINIGAIERYYKHDGKKNKTVVWISGVQHIISIKLDELDKFIESYYNIGSIGIMAEEDIGKEKKECKPRGVIGFHQPIMG